MTPGPSVRTAANHDLYQRIMPQPVEVDEAECDASQQRRVWATSRRLYLHRASRTGNKCGIREMPDEPKALVV